MVTVVLLSLYFELCCHGYCCVVVVVVVVSLL